MSISKEVKSRLVGVLYGVRERDVIIPMHENILTMVPEVLRYLMNGEEILIHL